MSRLVLTVCENFVREAAAALESLDDADVHLASFPSRCGRPPLTASEILQRAEVSLTNGLAAVAGSICCIDLDGTRPESMPLEVRRLSQCFNLIAPPDLVKAHLSEGAYLVTPGWLLRWREQVELLGLDATMAPLLIGGSASKVVLLDSGTAPGIEAALDEFSRFVGLPCQKVLIGLDYARNFMGRLLLECRLRLEREESLTSLRNVSRQAADGAASLDLVTSLAGMASEEEAVERVMDVCFTLFSPKNVAYSAIEDGNVIFVKSTPGAGTAPSVHLDQFPELGMGHVPLEHGFAVRVSHMKEVVGILEVNEVAFVQYLHRYVPLALVLGRVFGLSVSNARKYQRLRIAEDELRLANEQLEDADRRKDEFLAALSHELRNPISAIRNSLFTIGRLLPQDDSTAQERGVVERQVGHLAHLVDDLLDVSRVVYGKLRLDRVRLDLGALISRTVEDYRPVFSDREIHLTTHLSEQPLPVSADKTRVEQILGNLLTNASKFTGRGGNVDVYLDRAESFARLRVRDDGIGIHSDVLGRLFKPFVQAPQSLARSKGGVGLGLALVKGLAEYHGGSVAASSNGPGKGSEFAVMLPLDESEEVVARHAGPVSHPRRRILIIEDNSDAAESLSDALQVLGHDLANAPDGPSGIAAARAFRPDVLLCDIGLPGMDGYEVARRFRADPDLRTIVLVALTGYASENDLQSSREAGFDHHLAKPASIDRLSELLGSIPKEG